ncbi:MAG: ABC transporter permease [Lachnospiraceae bacterium]|nr:ABC transporter permease [Lachnospiraceae bacterium]
MKLGEIFKFTLEQFVHNFIKQFCIGCLLIVSMIAFGAIFLSDYKLNQIRYDLEDVLLTGIEDKGIIHAYTMQSDEKIAEIRKLECIDYIVGYSTGGTDYSWCKEIIDIQKQNYKNWINDVYILYYEKEGYYPYTSISKKTLEIANINFQSGGIIIDEDREEGVQYVYLGSDYKDIEVGTRFYDDTWKCDIVVAGIIKDGEEFLHEDMLSLLDNNVQATYNTDCMVFMETLAEQNDRMMFKVKDGYTVEYAIGEINKLYKGSGLNNRIYSLEDELLENEKYYKKEKSATKELLFVLAITIVVIQTCICISDFIGEKRYYGILYSNGMNNNDMIKMLVVQNILLFVVCGTISIGLGTIFLQDINLFELKYIKYILLRVAGVVFIMLSISIIIPAIYISKKRTVDLIYR